MTDIKIQDLSDRHYKKAIAHRGLTVDIGPFSSRIIIDYPHIAEEFRELYAPYRCHEREEIIDGEMIVKAPNMFRRWFRPQVTVDQGFTDLFIPLGADIGMVALEMGLNWGVVKGCRHLLFLHAGIVEKDGHVVILPGDSGSGKSTLSAGLSFTGWRLFSDEFGLVDLQDSMFVPYPRPVSLKNKSIDVLRELVGEGGKFSRNYHGTPKGTMAYLRPSAQSIAREGERASARKLIFPKFTADKPSEKVALTKTMGFFRLVKSSANYGVIGEDAFRAISRIIENCDIFDISFPSMEEGLRLVNEIVDNDEKSPSGQVEGGGLD